ncbi:hypothetical protein PIB30_067291 [Stylosanthes scabra]|uniref:Transposase, Ptta/En/Spm, plant n=1 Tax=Stylosanthes scabra TaxID=79078 RepID=A0ABU6SNJ8_9FABA|nr:hypothetical protein [Stylosanthes scabra]
MKPSTQNHVVVAHKENISHNKAITWSVVGKLHRTSHISGASTQHVSHPEPSSGSGAQARHLEIRPFRPPRDKASSVPPDSVENRQVYGPVVDNKDTEDEDYVPGSDELESFDDHIDNLFAAHDAEQQLNDKKRNRNKPWQVEVIEDGEIRPLPHTVFEANSISAGRKIVLRFDEFNQAVGEGAGLLDGFLGGLGADFKALPISMKGWHDMKDYKESVYNDVIKKTFHFEDPKGKIKEGILKKLGKNWKDTRSNLFNTFYDDTKSEDENEKCKKNVENRSKQVYIHTGGSKTLARQREEEERAQGKKFSRGEIWTMTHKKSDSSYIHEDARTEAIKVIETCDPSTKELSQNDSLAQVLEKEHLGRLRGMGACNTPIPPNHDAYMIGQY